MNDNKNVQLLNNKMWTRKFAIEAEVVVIKKSQVVEKTILLDKI